VAFEDALRDLEARDPFGAAELARMGLDVDAVYGFTEVDGEWVSPHGFALARAADALVAQRVRDKLVEGLRSGTPQEDVARSVSRTWDWPASYARTVVRTNVATAESAGRFREAQRVQEQTGNRVGFRVETAGDSDVRSGRAKDHGENHAAMDGFVARVDDPVWRTHTPPYSWMCRCLCVPVFGDEVPERFQRPPAAARFAPGFGGRADRLYP
jgi:SPP1 gp7 family putative phage head morphogenesis protein